MYWPPYGTAAGAPGRLFLDNTPGTNMTVGCVFQTIKRIVYCVCVLHTADCVRRVLSRCDRGRLSSGSIASVEPRESVLCGDGCSDNDGASVR